MSDAVKVVKGRPHGPGTHTGCRNPSGDGSIVSAVPENMGVDTEFVPIRPPGAEQEGAKNFVHSQDCPVDEVKTARSMRKFFAANMFSRLGGSGRDQKSPYSKPPCSRLPGR